MVTSGVGVAVAGGGSGTGVAVGGCVSVGVAVAVTGVGVGVADCCDDSELLSDDEESSLGSVSSGVGVGELTIGIELLTVHELMLMYFCTDVVALAGRPEDRNLWLPGALNTSASVIM